MLCHTQVKEDGQHTIRKALVALKAEVSIGSTVYSFLMWAIFKPENLPNVEIV